MPFLFPESKTNMLIRSTQKTDLPVIAKIEKQFLSSWPLSSLDDELSRPLGSMFTLENNGDVVGWAACLVVAGEAELLKIAVDTSYQRQGLGEYLLQNICILLKEKGAGKIFLEVRSQNIPALALYEKCDFTQIGMRKNYYSQPSDNALIFAKELIKSQL